MSLLSKLSIKYNAPVVLTFSIFCFVVYLLDLAIPNLSVSFFSVNASFDVLNPLSYFRLFSYTLGHADIQHLMGNMTFILLLGPIIEEKYGSKIVGLMFLTTALLTALINIILFSNGIMGASGIVFMLIILSSITNFSTNEIPLTFILVVTLFLGREVVNSFQDDNISQFAHIIGGVFGASFGFMINSKSST